MYMLHAVFINAMKKFLQANIKLVVLTQGGEMNDGSWNGWSMITGMVQGYHLTQI